MSNASRDEIERIIRQGFPDRPEVNAPFNLNTDAEKDRLLSSEFDDACSQHCAYLAVHVNDKRHRDFMRYRLVSSLLFGGELSPADKAWLIYLLAMIEDAPCDCKNGRPIDGNEETVNRLALVAFVIDDEIKNPGKARGYVTARLNRAAVALCKSYEAVKKIYYSKSFKSLLERMKERGFNPLGVK